MHVARSALQYAIGFLPCDHVAMASYEIAEKSPAAELSRRPMIRPNRPSTEEKISMIKILTNLDCVSPAKVTRERGLLTGSDPQHPPKQHYSR